MTTSVSDARLEDQRARSMTDEGGPAPRTERPSDENERGSASPGESADSSRTDSLAAARAILDRGGDGEAGVEPALRPAAWYWDLASGWLEWDEGLQAHFGHVERVTDSAWREDRIHPEDRARVQISLQRATITSRGVVWSDEHRFRRADGAYAIVNERAYVIHDAAGPRGVVGAMMPVSAVAEATGSTNKEAV